jgi:FAD synthetase
MKENHKKNKTKIMLFGTFDSLHPGHINLFKQAKRLAANSFLIVSIARDKNVLKIKKSPPLLHEKQRIKLVRKEKFVNKVVLGGLTSHLPHIIKEKPEIIALGYDQKYYVKNLKQELAKKGLSVEIIRLKPFKEKIYKNHLLKKKSRI